MDENQRDPDTYEFEVDEPGFRGTLHVTGSQGARHVTVSGTRPDSADTAVVKELPADRDERLAALVERCIQGDDRAAVQLLAHVGVLDPDA